MTSAPAVSARRFSSSRCSSTWAISSEPLRGAPIRKARSTGDWMSISCLMRISSEELLQRYIAGTAQLYPLVAQRRVEQHRARHAVIDGLVREKPPRRGADPRPLKPHRHHHLAVVRGRKIEGPVDQRVAKVRPLEVEPHLEP